MIRGDVVVRDVREALDERYPFAHRADWDNVGILVGDPGARVRRAVIALDATPAALALCRTFRADLLVTHHPVIHAPLKSLGPGPGGPAFELARRGTAVISAHTNADLAPRGVSWALARRMGLSAIRPLAPGLPGDSCKVAVFVPPDRAGAVLDALAGAGGGRIGAYDRCAFRTAGTGMFRPSPWASPRVGRRGADAEIEETRLESVVAGSLLPQVLRAVREAHPYEEPEIDVTPLSRDALGGGVGAVGDLARPRRLTDVLGDIHRRVRPAAIRVAGPRGARVRRVAVVAGSGSEFVGHAREAGADLFVTGDLKYHQALEIAAGGMPVADIGHGAGEKWILPEFRNTIAGRFGDRVALRVLMEEEPLRPFRPAGTWGGKKP